MQIQNTTATTTSKYWESERQNLVKTRPTAKPKKAGKRFANSKESTVIWVHLQQSSRTWDLLVMQVPVVLAAGLGLLLFLDTNLVMIAI